MSYTTYTTEALVCGTFNRNTADRSFLLFTREAGMLYAEARSVREERSKQRYALQDFTLVRVSLVKGKRSWKIGSIEAKRNYFAEAATKAARGSVVSTTRFLRRFFSGQEAAPALYDYVIEALTLLAEDITEREFVEKAVQVKLLKELGYVDSGAVPPEVTLDAPRQIAKDYSKETLATLDELLEKAVATSHL